MDAFVAVARAGSLAGAASDMNLTVPALSRRIGMLEAELGVRLFRRHARGLDLTEAGAAYFAALAPAWEGMRDATEAVRAQGRDGAIRVSVMPTFAANWLVPRLGRLRGRHADLRVEFHTSADLVDLEARPDIDAAIRLGRGPWPGLDCEPFLPVQAFPVASPAFVATLPAERRPRDLLLGHPLIGTSHQPAFWRDWFAGAGVDGPLPEVRGFDNLQLVYEAAAAGMGVALGLDPLVRPYVERGRLVRLFPGQVALPSRFHLLRRRGGTPDRRFRQFRTWLRTEAAAFAPTPAATV